MLLASGLKILCFKFSNLIVCFCNRPLNVIDVKSGLAKYRVIRCAGELIEYDFVLTEVFIVAKEVVFSLDNLDDVVEWTLGVSLGKISIV